MRDYLYIETRRGQPIVLHLDEYRSAKVKKINRGMFSTIYENLDAPEIFTVTPNDDDYSKEIVANVIDRRSPNPYLPRITKLGYMNNDAMVIFGMPKYRAPLVKSAGAVAWNEARILQQCLTEASKGLMSIADNGWVINDRVVECIRNRGLSKILVDAIEALSYSARNYGRSYCFEFPTRNLATDDSGHLILLDVMYDIQAVLNRNAAARSKFR